MTTEKVTGPEFLATNGKLPFLTNPEWAKSVSEGPLKFYTSAWKEALGFTASCFETQAEYVRKLSQCSDPAEALKCHAEFAQKSWVRSCDEGAKLLDNVRTNLATPLNN